MRRKFLQILTTSLTAMFIAPFNLAYAVTKKIINKNLTEEQKDILFNEGSEKPFTSALLGRGFGTDSTSKSSYLRPQGHAVTNRSQVVTVSRDVGVPWASRAR